MSRLGERLAAQKKQGRKGLIVYLTAGYPDPAVTVEAVRAAAEAGADVVEIGIPFSDPIADGPVIQQAATQALKAGFTTAKALELVRELRSKSDIPLAAMTYVNTILSYGPERFAADFAAAGLDGLIVPDVPLEEMEFLQEICQQHKLDLIRFIAPTTTVDRIKRIGVQAGGFLYCISTTGVTGVRAVDYRPVLAAIQQARKVTDVPVAIGFGIGTPAAAREAAQYADAVIVGSAVVEKLGSDGVDGVRELVRAIRRELDKESG